jgi:CrcB protein
MAPSSRFLAVYVGGTVGTLARAGVAEGIASPWCTLVVNVVGCLLLGYVVTALPERRPLLGTGFCGGLTTFSTLQLEALELSTGDAIAYLAASALLGWLAVAAGRRLA